MQQTRALLALPVLLAVGATACSSASEKVADQVQKQVAKELSIGEGAVSASCPDGVKAKKDQVFQCDLEIDAQKVKATITFVSDKQFSVGYDGRLFPKQILADQVQADIQAKQNSQVTDLDCGGGATFVFIPYTDTIECHGTTADGQAGTAVVSVQQDGQPFLESMTADAAS